MGILDMTRFVEHLRFFDGQRLFADDLQGVEAFNREMRWLHNRSLHQPGIGSGFAVSGPVDAREVTVGPGYALDGEGREIVLTAALVVPVPPVAHGKDTPVAYFDLTVSYPPDEALEDTTAETRGGVCVPAGAVRLREQPALCWVPLRGPKDDLKPETALLAADLRLSHKIVLARVGVENCKIRSLDLAPRPVTRTTCRPHIACGVADAKGLLVKDRVNLYAELQLRVDTSGGKFQATPTYLVRVESGEKPLALGDGGSEDPMGFFPHPVFFRTQVLKPTPQDFVAGIVVPLHARDLLIGGTISETDPAELDARLTEAIQTAAAEWRIVWMGVEE